MNWYLFVGAGTILIIFIVASIKIIKLILVNRKGAISIFPDKYEYTFGQIINGELKLSLSRAVQVDKLIIGVICESKIINKKTNSHIVYDWKSNLDGNKKIEEGEYSYDFYLELPYRSANMYGKGVKWYIYSKLECPGLNLFTKSKIDVKL